jgi:hypothetical protein
MRLFLVPLAVYALAPVDVSTEPSERAMRKAFEASLQVQVKNALEFLEGSGGPEAVARVREAGTDRFEVRTFKKLECAREADAHVCNFLVDVTVVNGAIEKIVKGRFVQGPDHSLTFVQDI